MDEGISMGSCEGEQDFWDDLLAYIEAGRVIPVVGPELLNLTVSGKAVPLYQAIAEQLLKKNGLSAVVGEKPDSSRPEDLSRNEVFLRSNHELNDAVTALAYRGKRVQDLYRPVHDVLSTTTLNSFKKNYEGPVIGLELGFERYLNFAEIQNHLKILGFHFQLNAVVLVNA